MRGALVESEAVRTALVFSLVLSATASAQVTSVGELIIVSDATGSIHQRLAGLSLGLVTPQGLACQDASRAALGSLGDAYDFLVVFMSEPNPGATNVPTFQQARVTAQNIGANPLLNDGTPFGSRAQLKGCLFMGSIQRLPPEPDALATNLGSGVTGLTALEVLGHELGHAWLVGADYDLGAGKQEDLRSGDRHYSPRVDSRSVMFGGCIDALGGGDFRVSACARGYNSLDLYFMGLLPAADVQPLLVVVGQGSNDPPLPLPPGSAPVTIQGFERRVGIDAVVRQMGTRSPPHPTSQRCFRVGFVYVTRGPASPAAVLTIEAYRRAFEGWFRAATGGRGFVDARAIGSGCREPSLDGGLETDAGTIELDAGQPDAGPPALDGGGGDDAGLEVPDSGAPERLENQRLKPLGCSCNEAGALPVLLAVALIVLGARRASQ